MNYITRARISGPKCNAKFNPLIMFVLTSAHNVINAGVTETHIRVNDRRLAIIHAKVKFVKVES